MSEKIVTAAEVAAAKKAALEAAKYWNYSTFTDEEYKVQRDKFMALDERHRQLYHKRRQQLHRR